MSFISIWTVALLLAVIILAVGIYVYRDARDRGMQPGLWAAIAVLMPCFIGLILYILMRDDDRNLKCPDCGYPVKAVWKVCPMCQRPLEHLKTAIAGSLLQKEDKGMWKLIAVAVIVPIMICFVVGHLIMNSELAPFKSNYVSSSMASMGVTRDQIEDGTLQQWLDACNQKEDAMDCYVLAQVNDSEENQGEKEVNYVLYVSKNDNLKFADSKNFEGVYQILLETQEGKNENGCIIMGTAHYRGSVNLEIFIDGKEYEVAYTKADFDLKKIIDETIE